MNPRTHPCKRVKQQLALVCSDDVLFDVEDEHVLLREWLQLRVPIGAAAKGPSTPPGIQPSKSGSALWAYKRGPLPRDATSNPNSSETSKWSVAIV